MIFFKVKQTLLHHLPRTRATILPQQVSKWRQFSYCEPNYLICHDLRLRLVEAFLDGYKIYKMHHDAIMQF